MKTTTLVMALASLLASGTARAETYVRPCADGECTVPVADGDVDDLEYADGAGYPLSNFDSGGPNGAVRLQLTGDKLTIGLRLPGPPEGGSRRGTIDLYFDADRPGTSCVPIIERPQAEDRAIRVQYDLGNHAAATAQQVGNGATWQAPTGPMPWMKYWPITHYVTEPADDPGMFHVEMTVVLRPTSSSTSQVLTDGSLGFAMVHRGDSAFEHMPGAVNHVPDQVVPCTWETLDFGEPEGTPLSMTVWEVQPYEEDAPDAGKVAEEIWDRDLVCLTEIGEDDQQGAILATANMLRSVHGLAPFHAVSDGWQWDDADETGLQRNLLLSSRPVLQSETFTTKALWARVLTEAGVSPDGRAPIKGDEFIDVYCANSNDDTDLGSIKGFIDNTRAPDRPAFLLIYGPGGFPNAMGLWNLDQLTPFDQVNSWLSDTYDLNGLPGGLGATAALHIVALPATDTWPAFGIEKEPQVTSDTPFDEVEGEEITGFPEQHANAVLVRTDQPGHYNPMKKHLVTYRVQNLTDLDGGGCCADWYTDKIGFLGGPFSGFTKEQTPAGDSVQPGWWAARELAAGTITATVEVWEYDSGSGDDHYDVTPELNTLDRDPFFRITHLSGLVERVSSGGQSLDVLGTFEASQGTLTTTTTGTLGTLGTAVHVITAEEVD
ncbi:MAG TPA: hypothetical protein VK698_08930 [Kofleriaceae bacterium]|nr:hypothetical protein [Kofleriaceae bacterium]